MRVSYTGIYCRHRRFFLHRLLHSGFFLLRRGSTFPINYTLYTLMAINIGIEEAHRKQIAEGLSRLLADTYILYLKTHNFHWNVTGPMFVTLHTLFEEHYTELATAIDEIAERIRALDFPAPGSFAQYNELTSIDEESGLPDAKEMIRQLVEGQEAVVRTARSIVPIAEAAGDDPTADLVINRMQIHEKNAWMLRSLLA